LKERVVQDKTTGEARSLKDGADAESKAKDETKAKAIAASFEPNFSCKGDCGKPWFSFVVDDVRSFSQAVEYDDPTRPNAKFTVYFGRAILQWHLDVKCDPPGEWHWGRPGHPSNAKLY
jgi:hypothetical protein